jgi:hypothetical protein
MKIKISEPVLVFAPEMNERVARWGVYAIPRMWREKNCELVIRFNGEADNADTNSLFVLKNLYFVSRDNGESWENEPRGEDIYDISILTGIDPPYLSLENGEKIFFKYKTDCAPIKGVPFTKDFMHPCGEAMVHSYRYGDIPDECKGFYLGRIDPCGNIGYEDICFDFPEREVLVNYRANPDTAYVADVEEYIQPFIFKSPYMSSLNRLSDGTLVALATGQNPHVDDRFCSEVYLVASSDNGKTWVKRATVASGMQDVPYGYGGDGGEVSLAIAEDDTMYCVMRMDMSIHPEKDESKCWGCRFSASFDKGKTWTAPKEIADSSVTPHIVTLSGGTLLVVYGRPGVHFKISTDKGETWSRSYSIIGETLTDERKSGRSDMDSKYADTCSYSNTFVEKLSENSIIVCYNDLRYPDKNGTKTKAAFVRRIEIEQE